MIGTTEPTVVEDKEKEEQSGEAKGEEEGSEAQPSSKVRRGNETLEEDPYTYSLDKELREEMKKRKFRTTGRKREEMILLLKEDSRKQRKIVIGDRQLGGRGEANVSLISACLDSSLLYKPVLRNTHSV